MTEASDELSAALSRLDELADIDVGQHIAIFEALHTAMQQVLADGQDT